MEPLTFLAGAVRLSRDADGIAVLEFHDPAGRNALSEATQAHLSDALVAVAEDQGAKVLVLTGLPDMFCSGASREKLLDLAEGRMAHTKLLLPRALLDVPIPTIAAMEGSAVGGGFTFGLTADIVLMARESRYGANFMDYGLTPGMGTTAVLEHALSRAVAHELMFTAELRRGADFQGLSGINHILPRAQVRTKALDIANRIAEKPRVALETLKRTLAMPRRRAYEDARILELLMFSASAEKAGVAGRVEEVLAD